MTMDADTAKRLGLRAVSLQHQGPNATGVAFTKAPGVQVFRREDRGDVLLVHLEPDADDPSLSTTVTWALLESVAGPPEGPSVKEADRFTKYEVIVHGYGFESGLREARHTWFGADGYVHFVQPDALAWGFGILAKWFDYR